MTTSTTLDSTSEDDVDNSSPHADRSSERSRRMLRTPLSSSFESLNFHGNEDGQQQQQQLSATDVSRSPSVGRSSCGRIRTSRRRLLGSLSSTMSVEQEECKNDEGEIRGGQRQQQQQQQLENNYYYHHRRRILLTGEEEDYDEEDDTNRDFNNDELDDVALIEVAAAAAAASDMIQASTAASTTAESTTSTPIDSIPTLLLSAESVTSASNTTTSNNNNSSSNNDSYLSAESLVTLLKRVRSQDPNIQWIILERRKLPTPYLIALLHAVAESKFITKLRLHRVVVNNNNSNSSENCYPDGSNIETNETTIEVAVAIAHCIRNSLTLIDLDISKNNLGDIGTVLIAGALEDIGKHCSIKRLNLSNNQISDAGIMALVHALPQTNVSILKLGHNKFGVQGLQALCSTLITTTTTTSSSATGTATTTCSTRTGSASTITSLDLRGNNLGSKKHNSTEKINILATTLLNESCTLRVLYLNRNHLTDTAICTLAKSLESNTSLHTLDLQRNDAITDSGARAFVQCLQLHNDTFTKLKLCAASNKHTTNNGAPSNKISDTVKQELFDWLLVNAYGPVLARKTKNEYHTIQNILRSSVSDKFDDNNNDHHQHVLCNQQQQDCVICCDNISKKPPSIVLLPCKHNNLCCNCAERLQHCHMCREAIVKVMKIPSQQEWLRLLLLSCTSTTTTATSNSNNNIINVNGASNKPYLILPSNQQCSSTTSSRPLSN